jgi:hypothetical protein
MRSGWASLLAAGISAHSPAAAAQGGGEIGLHTLVTTSAPALWGAGLYAAVRPSARFRIAATAAAGEAGGKVAGRGELIGHFLLNPTGRHGAGAYAGGGVAGVLGPTDEGYLLLLLGLEGQPGAAAGWALELGVGGGIRIAAGYRWRRLPR